MLLVSKREVTIDMAKATFPGQDQNQNQPQLKALGGWVHRAGLLW